MNSENFEKSVIVDWSLSFEELETVFLGFSQ